MLRSWSADCSNWLLPWKCYTSMTMSSGVLQKARWPNLGLVSEAALSGALRFLGPVRSGAPRFLVVRVKKMAKWESVGSCDTPNRAAPKSAWPAAYTASTIWFIRPWQSWKERWGEDAKVRGPLKWELKNQFPGHRVEQYNVIIEI